MTCQKYSFSLLIIFAYVDTLSKAYILVLLLVWYVQNIQHPLFVFHSTNSVSFQLFEIVLNQIKCNAILIKRYKRLIRLKVCCTHCQFLNGTSSMFFCIQIHICIQIYNSKKKLSSIVRTYIIGLYWSKYI